MEALNLSYLNQHRVLVCQDCAFALTPYGYERHLRDLHGAKGSRLHAAILEIRGLDLQEPNSVTIPNGGQSPIQGLKITPNFRCVLPACNEEAEALSQHRRKVEKHQSRIHRVLKTKARKPCPQDIEVVCVQSFFPSKYYRPFIVRSDPDGSVPLQGPSLAINEAVLHAEGPEPDTNLDSVRSQYEASQRDWWQAFGELPNIEESRITIPPWLKETGIAEYIHRQLLNKAALRVLVQRIKHGTSACNVRDIG